jgi:hypothetical protein
MTFMVLLLLLVVLGNADVGIGVLASAGIRSTEQSLGDGPGLLRRLGPTSGAVGALTSAHAAPPISIGPNRPPRTAHEGKPFSYPELRARVVARLRRAELRRRQRQSLRRDNFTPLAGIWTLRTSVIGTRLP